MASPTPTIDLSSRWENRFLVGLFIVALLYGFYGITYNWRMGFLSGHEFRQSQTALTTYYIDQQNNFSLLYETPVLGKPWVSILLEVPIYEWAVVDVSRALGLPHHVAARTVSALCFYLSLPAIYALLARFSVPRARRLLILALVVSAPVYIYYSRAFLMDSMAFMGCVWFLLGFVRTMDARSWGWLAVTTVAGTAAALIKSATLAVWLPPAVGYGVWLLWRDWRNGAGWTALLKTTLWGLATVVIALGALRWWVMYTDPIKEAHASAWIFTSKNLSQGNWGLFDPRPLFSKELWGFLLNCWKQAIMWPWLLGACLVAGLIFPASRWRVLGVGGLFFVAQFLFPFAYAYQDYYYYSCAVFALVAVGFMLLAVLDSKLPRWCVVLIVIAPFAAQVMAYWQDYRKVQSIWHHGGYPFTEVLRDLTPKDSVLVVAGADWAAMTPLYSQRRALMIRNGLQYDRPYLDRAFKDMEGENVSAVVLFGEMRNAPDFINRVTAQFDMDATTPTLSWGNVDVYVSRPYAKAVQIRVKQSARYPEVKIHEPPPVASNGVTEIHAEKAREAFPNITPAPFKVDFQFGVGWLSHGDLAVLSAHPNMDMWITPPADATEIRWSFGIFDGAFTNPDGKTDGVDFMILGEMPDGSSRRVYRRLLDPTQVAGDRGDQHMAIAYKPREGETLRFSTRPFGGSAFDWAYTLQIKVK